MNKNYSINLFRIIATIFVVGIHSFGFYSINKNIYLTLKALFNVAVPFFFLTSGYFMYISLSKRTEKNEKHKYLYKYLLNLLLIYLFYTLIDGFLIYIEFYYIENTKVNIINWIFSKETLFGLHTGGFFYSIWFLMALIHSHLIIYCFKNKLELLTILSFIIYIVLYIFQVIEIIPISRTVFTIGLLFTSLGYLISKYNKNILSYLKDKSNNVLILINILLLILLIMEFKLVYFNFDIMLSSYITLVPLTINNFIILIKNPNIFKNDKIFILGNNTFGVYILHSFVLKVLSLILNHNNINQYFITNILGFIIFIITIYIVSYIIYYGLISIFHKIKGLKS